jgi:hypothetical protein
MRKIRIDPLPEELKLRAREEAADDCGAVVRESLDLLVRQRAVRDW